MRTEVQCEMVEMEKLDVVSWFWADNSLRLALKLFDNLNCKSPCHVVSQCVFFLNLISPKIIYH